ncbi:MAG: type II toxin-antitoxin system RelE family toxin [Promethearchaeota archaeon]
MSKTSYSQLNQLDVKTKDHIIDVMKNLAENPFQSRSGVDIKKLHSPADPPLFRLRVGNYRVVYFVVKKDVKITKIFHRKKGYKWLE